MIYTDFKPDKESVKLIKDNFTSLYLKQKFILPSPSGNGRFTFFVTEKTRSDAVSDCMLKYDIEGGLDDIDIVPLKESEIIKMINSLFELTMDSSKDVASEATGQDGYDSLKSFESLDLIDIKSDAPAIKLINTLILEALGSNASDIHIEPYEDHFIVRFRIDGSLTDVISPPIGLQSAMVSRIKVMSGLDIAEKRLPQDGRIQIKAANRNVDIRVSVIPTLYGERVVLRLLDKSLRLFDIYEIGIDPRFIEHVKTSLSKSHGMIITTGPTGSGKTTTLYSFIHSMLAMFPDKNTLTIEDPVEYQIPKISQMHVNSKIGLTFASGLRHILRQDPDVIMVGEIRDPETAGIAVQSALTGHLVLSTLHTNDASSAFTRLIDMGIEPFLVASSLELVFAQRLLRVLCPDCKKSVKLSKRDIDLYFMNDITEDRMFRNAGIKTNAGEECAGGDADAGGVSYNESIESIEDIIEKGEFFEQAGCDKCNHTGFKGRTAIYEILELNDEIRSMVMEKRNSHEIKLKALNNGMSTLRMEAIRKLASGVTSISEIIRVTQEDK